MEASLHTEHGHPRERTSDKVPLMTDSGGVWEVWDLGVGDDGRVLEHVSELTETTTKDDSGTNILRKA